MASEQGTGYETPDRKRVSTRVATYQVEAWERAMNERGYSSMSQFVAEMVDRSLRPWSIGQIQGYVSDETTDELARLRSEVKDLRERNKRLQGAYDRHADLLEDTDVIQVLRSVRNGGATHTDLATRLESSANERAARILDELLSAGTIVEENGVYHVSEGRGSGIDGLESGGNVDT